MRCVTTLPHRHILKKMAAQKFTPRLILTAAAILLTLTAALSAHAQLPIPFAAEPSTSQPLSTAFDAALWDTPTLAINDIITSRPIFVSLKHRLPEQLSKNLPEHNHNIPDIAHGMLKAYTKGDLQALVNVIESSSQSTAPAHQPHKRNADWIRILAGLLPVCTIFLTIGATWQQLSTK